MKCPLCRSRKGKRRCPALNEDICAICCGEKRVVEIDCPADCSYLVEGQRREMLREWEEYARRQDPAKTRRWLAALQGLLPVLEVIEQSIVEVAAVDRDLAEEDLAEALGTLRRTYASEASGVVTEPSAVSPRVEMLLREIRGGLTRLRDEVRKKKGGDLPPQAIVECLEVLIDRQEFHRARSGGTGSLVAHLRRVRPPAGRPERKGPESRIILP